MREWMIIICECIPVCNCNGNGPPINYEQQQFLFHSCISKEIKNATLFLFSINKGLRLFICNYRTLWQFGITWDCVLYFSPPFLHSSSSIHKRTSTNIIDPFFLLGTTNSINTIPNLPSRWLLIYNPLSCCLKVPYMSSKYLGIGITYKHLW